MDKLQVRNVQLDELYAIDSRSLRAVAPVYAVIFLFKYGAVDRQHAVQGIPLDGEYDTLYQEKGIFFARQTIGNACATQAIVNSLLNKTNEVDIGPELGGLRQFVTGFDAEMCGDTLSNSEVIRRVHNSFSAPRLLDTGKEPQNRDERDNGVFHFVAYAKMHGYIYELDGLQPYPIRHDAVASDEAFYDVLPAVLERRIAKYAGEMRFSLLAVTNDKLTQNLAIGDDMAVEQELAKRDTWKRENDMRRHDFPLLIIALVKNIGKGMLDEEFEAFLAEARERELQMRAKDH